MLETKDIKLRDFIESDIKWRIHWETVETEWQLWDAPWEYEGLTEAQKAADLREYIDKMRKWVERYKNISYDEKRSTFQIETNTPEKSYIGWVSSYCIDEDYNYSDTDTERCAVGIDLPDMSARGRGYAYQALCLFINYLLEHGETEIYTQTWSGNERMIHVAGKMGFEECCRKIDFRTVRGAKYDGLTFKLNKNKFFAFSKEQFVHKATEH